MLERYTVITNNENEFPSTNAPFLVYDNLNREWITGYTCKLEAESQMNDWNTQEWLKLPPAERRSHIKLVS